MIEYSCKIKEEVKAKQSEIKQNIQGTNNEGKETRTQINDLEQKEEMGIQTEENDETRIQKNKERLRSLQDNFERSTIWITGVPEEEEQEIENLFQKIVKENFPNLSKEMNMQVQEGQRVPKKLDPRKHTPRYIIIKLPKIKERENLKSNKRKGDSYLQKSSHKTISWFIKRNLTGSEGLVRSIWSHERQEFTSKIAQCSKAVI